MQLAASGSVPSSLIPSSKDLGPTVTVVVCTRNRSAALRNCLESIARLEHAPDEVIVVDNTTGDSQAESLAWEFSARYLIEPQTGLSRARNRGLIASKYEIVAFLDDDAWAEKSWLRFLLEPFSNPNIAVVTGKVVTPEPCSGDSAHDTPRTLSNKDPQWFEIATFGGTGMGGNMAFRKEACPSRNLFDVRLGRGTPLWVGEENHAFAYLLSQGHSAVYIPDAVVFHPPLTRSSVEHEAACAIAYWLLLFFDFPQHRFDLMQFLFTRMRHKPLAWQRDSPGLGSIVTSGWLVLSKASLVGTWLYFTTRKLKDT